MDPLMLALRVILALGAVVGVLWFIQKRVTGHQIRTRAGDPLTVVARRGIGAKASVVVIDTDGRRMVLGVTEQSVSVLHEGDAPEPAPEAPAPAAASTGSVFAAALAGVKGNGAPEPAILRHPDLTVPGRPPLQGSVLSAATWRQAAAALRKGPLR